MEGIDLLPVLSTKSSVLFDAVGMEHINPERGVIDAVCHPAQIRAFSVYRIYWLELSADTYDDFHAQRPQGRLIKSSRSMNIRYSDSGVVDEPIAVVCHLAPPLPSPRHTNISRQAGRNRSRSRVLTQCQDLHAGLD